MPQIYPPRPPPPSESRFHTPAATGAATTSEEDGPTITMKFASPARAVNAAWNQVRELDREARAEYADLLARVNQAEERLMAAEDERDSLRTQLRLSETKVVRNSPMPALHTPRSPRATAATFETLRVDELAAKLSALETSLRGPAPLPPPPPMAGGLREDVRLLRDRLASLEREVDSAATPSRHSGDLSQLAAMKERLESIELGFALGASAPQTTTAVAPRPEDVAALRSRLAAVESSAASDTLREETVRLRARLESLEAAGAGMTVTMPKSPAAAPRTPGGTRRAMRDIETGEVIVVDQPKVVSQEEVALKERLAMLEGLMLADGKLPEVAAATSTSSSSGAVVSEGEASLKERLAMIEGIKKAQDKKKAEEEEEERKKKEKEADEREKAVKAELAMREKLALLEGMELQRRIDNGEEVHMPMLSPARPAAADTSTATAEDDAMLQRIAILEGIAIERGNLPKEIVASMPIKERIAMLEGSQIERGRNLLRAEAQVSDEELALRERLAILEGREAAREAGAATTTATHAAPRSPASYARSEEVAILRTRLKLLRGMRGENGMTPKKVQLISEEEAKLVERLGFLEGAEIEKAAKRERDAEREKEEMMTQELQAKAAEELRLRERIAYLEGQAAEREASTVQASELALRERLASLEGAVAEKGLDLPFEPLPPLASSAAPSTPGTVSDTEAALRERIAMLEGAINSAMPVQYLREGGSPLRSALKSPRRTPGRSQRRGVTSEELRLKERIAMLEGMELANSASKVHVAQDDDEVSEVEAVLKERVALLEGMQMARQQAEVVAEEKAAKKEEDAQISKVSKRLADLENIINPPPPPPVSAEVSVIHERIDLLTRAVEEKLGKSPGMRTKDPDKDSIVDDVVAHVRERTANAVEQTLRREREEALQAVEDALDDSEHSRMRRRAAARAVQKEHDAIASGAPPVHYSSAVPASAYALHSPHHPVSYLSRPTPVPYTLIPTPAAPVILTSPPRARYPGVDEAYLVGQPDATKPHHRGAEARYIDLLYGHGVALDRPIDADPNAIAASATIDALSTTLREERENALMRQERRRQLWETQGDPIAVASVGHMERSTPLVSETSRVVPETPSGASMRAPEWAALGEMNRPGHGVISATARAPAPGPGPAQASAPAPTEASARGGGGSAPSPIPLAEPFDRVNGDAAGSQIDDARRLRSSSSGSTTAGPETSA